MIESWQHFQFSTVVSTFAGRNEMVNFGKITMESKKGARFDITSDTNPQLIFVPSRGNILVIIIL